MRAASRPLVIACLICLQACLPTCGGCSSVATGVDLVLEPHMVELAPGTSTTVELSVSCVATTSIELTYGAVTPQAASAWFVPGAQPLKGDCEASRGITLYVPIAVTADAPDTTFEVALSALVAQGTSVRTLAYAVTVHVKASGWRRLSDGLNVAAPMTRSTVLPPVVTLGADDKPLAAWVENNDLYVAQWTGTAWQRLGARVNTQPATASPSLAVDASGAPIVAWQEDVPNEGGNVYVARFSDNAWQLLDGALDLTLSLDATTPVVLARLNDIAVAFSHAEATGGSRIVVRAWSGTAWSAIGTGGGPAVVAMTENLSPKLALTGTLSNLGLAVLWSQGSTPRVAELVGTTWSPRPDPFTSQVGTVMDIAANETDGVLVVAQPISGQFSVRRWDGASWTNLGTPHGPTAANAVVMGVALSHRFGNSPLLAWSFRDGPTHQTVVERWSMGWAALGSRIDAVDRRGDPAFEGQVSVADGTAPAVVTLVVGSLPAGADQSVVVHEYR